MPYCSTCGTRSGEGTSYCSACRASLSGQSESGEWSNSSSTTKDTQYYIGVVLTAICVILFPYFLFLVALPEAILAFWGKSIQDSLGSSGRENPFMNGSFLIIRWFGNFLLLLVALGFVGGLFLIAL